jgi:pyridoxamine 5'-phosphate oxidase|tara:strand:- start:18598 stop:19215 length:618 start_codon:yes stop_codon:yes gene_type:complete
MDFKLTEFLNIEDTDPYNLFKELFQNAENAGQKNTDAICVSTFNKKEEEVTSRYLNLKYVKGNKWYFFSNYSSKKAMDIRDNNQVSALVFWSQIHTQIRMKAKIFVASSDVSDEHFKKRSIEKNALAISSNQSSRIESFDCVEKNFQKSLKALKEDKSIKRPDYWGGYYFIPYYFEFWRGHHNRLNKRVVYESAGNNWNKYFLEP